MSLFLFFDRIKKINKIVLQAVISTGADRRSGDLSEAKAFATGE